MSLANRVRRPSVVLAASLAVAIPALSPAASLEITIVDDDGRPVPCVAVYAVRQPGGRSADAGRAAARVPAASAAAAHAAAGDAQCAQAARAARGTERAVMDQKDNAFVPHMLVVQRGTAVTFPNSDSVSHHVYLFSEAKRFELALYKGNQHPPLVFDRPGIVVLGCNIHDGMLGYVVVVDTPHFATTDTAGRAVLHGLAAGAYTVDVFTPRAKPKDVPSARTVTLAGDADAARVELAFSGRLSAPHGASDNLTWHRY